MRRAVSFHFAGPWDCCSTESSEKANEAIQLPLTRRNLLQLLNRKELALHQWSILRCTKQGGQADLVMEDLEHWRVEE